MPVVFLICAGRAGAGFLQSILDSHPEIVMLPMELKFHENWKNYCENKEKDLETLCDIWFRKTKISRFKTGILYGLEIDDNSYTNCDIKLLEKHFRAILERDGISKKSVFFALHEAYARSIGQDLNRVKVIVEFPASPVVLNLILEDFPNTKFIEVVRDPRANFLSLKNQSINVNGNLVSRRRVGYKSTLIEIIKDLKNQYKFIRDSGVSKLKKRWIIIKQEDLHLNNKNTIDRLVRWLGIISHVCLKKSTLGGKLWQGNSSSQKPVLGVSPDIVYRWEKEIQRNERYLIEFFFSDELRYHSYDSMALNKFALFSSLFLPIKGEFFIKTRKTKPISPRSIRIWNINKYIIILLRVTKNIDKVLISPFMFLLVRFWVLKKIIHK